MSAGGAIGALRRFGREVSADAERCEDCGAALADLHAHRLGAAQRLRCVCDACGDRFDGTLVRRRVVALESTGDWTEEWAAIGLPIDLAFFTTSERVDGATAHFPSPAGATRAPVDHAAWVGLCRRIPLAARLRTDVEALLVDRRRGADERYLVSIDVCHQLVGVLRTRRRAWGAAFGEEADRFMTDLRREATTAGGGEHDVDA